MSNLGKNEKLLKAWKKVGFRFNCTASKENVDIEQLIVSSSIAGRDEPDLIWSVVSWLIIFGDLVNVPRLVRMLNEYNESIIGALFELAVENGADSKLKNVVKNCRSRKPDEILFNIMKETSVAAQYEKVNTLSVFRRWGYYCSSVSIKKDALHTRQYVLRNNKNLALRAVFGANAKSEILYLLLHIPRGYITQIAKKIELSYQPVYAEIEHLIKNHMVKCEQMGRMKIISLSERTVEFLNALPV